VELALRPGKVVAIQALPRRELHRTLEQTQGIAVATFCHEQDP